MTAAPVPLARMRPPRYMPPMQGSTGECDLEIRRKRLRFRSQRRGFREVDLIFGTFAAAELAQLSEPELDQFEALLNVPDQEIYLWLTGKEPVASEFDTPVFARMQALCCRDRPEWNV